MNNETFIDSPSPNDVILGRGGGSNRHAGNIRYRDIVESMKPTYNDSKKFTKQGIAWSIMEEIWELNPPGRFLEKVNGKWKVAAHKKALRKTSQALREKPRPREAVCSVEVRAANRDDNNIPSAEGRHIRNVEVPVQNLPAPPPQDDANDDVNKKLQQDLSSSHPVPFAQVDDLPSDNESLCSSVLQVKKLFTSGPPSVSGDDTLSVSQYSVSEFDDELSIATSIATPTATATDTFLAGEEEALYRPLFGPNWEFVIEVGGPVQAPLPNIPELQCILHEV